MDEEITSQLPPTTEPTPMPPTTTYKCPKCPETFSSPFGLRVHTARKHGSPAKMAAWNRNIAKAQSDPKLRAQITKSRGLIPRKKQFVCESCGDGFATIQALGLHKYRAHTPVKKQTKQAKQSREEKLAKMREYSAQRRAERKAGLTVPPSKTPERQREYQRAYNLRRKLEQQQQNGPAEQAQPAQAAPKSPSSACPNFCPNCGFGLSAVSVALTIPNR